MKSKLFEPFFREYEILTKHVDGLVEKIRHNFPYLVKCKLKCSDCCNALFDLTFIEALYINNHFNKIFDSEKKILTIKTSNKVDRKIHKLKRKAQNSVKSGDKSQEQVLYEMATFKVKCPLLNADKLCDMYKFRPITCRTYGVPTSFAGHGHTCGLSDFKTGVKYPTINLDALHKKLYLLSSKLVETMESKYNRMAEVLMPLSMALLTNFDDTYLGLKENKKRNQ